MTQQVDVRPEGEVSVAPIVALPDGARARATSVAVDSPRCGGPVTDEFQALCEEWLPCMYDWRALAVPASEGTP
jgi:hypothetical protein